MNNQCPQHHFRVMYKTKTSNLNKLAMKLGISCVKEPSFRDFGRTWKKDEDLQSILPSRESGLDYADVDAEGLEGIESL